MNTFNLDLPQEDKDLIINSTLIVALTLFSILIVTEIFVLVKIRLKIDKKGLLIITLYALSFVFLIVNCFMI